MGSGCFTRITVATSQLPKTPIITCLLRIQMSLNKYIQEVNEAGSRGDLEAVKRIVNEVKVCFQGEE